MLDEKTYRELIHQMFDEMLTQKNFDVFDSIAVENALYFNGRDKIKGRDAIKKAVIERSLADPNLSYTVDKIIVKGDDAFAKWHGIGTAQMDFADFKAGELVNYWGLTMMKATGDKISEFWAVSSIDDLPQPQ